MKSVKVLVFAVGVFSTVAGAAAVTSGSPGFAAPPAGGQGFFGAESSAPAPISGPVKAVGTFGRAAVVAKSVAGLAAIGSTVALTAFLLISTSGSSAQAPVSP